MLQCGHGRLGSVGCLFTASFWAAFGLPVSDSLSIRQVFGSAVAVDGLALALSLPILPLPLCLLAVHLSGDEGEQLAMLVSVMK